MKHAHKWEIYYQGGKCPVNHNFEECPCGKLRDYIQIGDGMKEYIEETDKETMLKLKEEVKSWDIK